MSTKMQVRAVLNFLTMVWARWKKKPIFFNAQTTASTQNKQVNVLKSKYPKYSLSGGIIKAVISAAKKAMHITAFFLTKPITFSINTPFLTKVIITEYRNSDKQKSE